MPAAPDGPGFGRAGWSQATGPDGGPVAIHTAPGGWERWDLSADGHGGVWTDRTFYKQSAEHGGPARWWLVETVTAHPPGGADGGGDGRRRDEPAGVADRRGGTWRPNCGTPAVPSPRT